MRWPGGGQKGQEVTSLTEAIDVVPTILDLCAVPIPTAVQGQSFLSVLEGNDYPGRSSALTESEPCTAIRTDGHRYVCYRDGREMLYDLEAAPHEYSDVSSDSDYSAVLSDHRLELCQRLMSTSLPRRREWAY